MDIKALREKLGLSQQKLADKTGISKSRIEKWETGKAKPKVDDYNTLQHFFKTEGVATPDSDVSNIKLIPFYDADAAAGESYDMNISSPARPIGTIDVGDMLRDSEAALRVYGNSMIPGYPPGCVVGLKQCFESFIEPGHVYVIETGYNRYVKRLYYSKDKSAFRCISDNPVKHDHGPMTGEYCYPEFEIPLKEVKKLFFVTGVIKRNNNGMIMSRNSNY
jgi:phage repressor protein C with HTH and peptisase S24 domain